MGAIKKQPVEKINAAIAAGLGLIGSNYYQEYEEIAPKLKGEFILHYIGRIQSSKINDLVDDFDLLETLFKIKHYKKIVRACKESNKQVPLLIEVNIGKENSKDGVFPDKLPQLLNKISDIYSKKFTPLAGFMTMGTWELEEKEKRAEFKKFRTLCTKMFNEFSHLFIRQELSFGMSNDYLLAIEYGATIVRLGTALFGERK